MVNVVFSYLYFPTASMECYKIERPCMKVVLDKFFYLFFNFFIPNGAKDASQVVLGSDGLCQVVPRTSGCLSFLFRKLVFTRFLVFDAACIQMTSDLQLK